MQVWILFPNNIVSEQDFAASKLGVPSYGCDHVVRCVFLVLVGNFRVATDDRVLYGCPLGRLRDQIISSCYIFILIVTGCKLMLDRKGLYGKSYNTIFSHLVVDSMDGVAYAVLAGGQAALLLP